MTTRYSIEMHYLKYTSYSKITIKQGLPLKALCPWIPKDSEDLLTDFLCHLNYVTLCFRSLTVRMELAIPFTSWDTVRMYTL